MTRRLLVRWVRYAPRLGLTAEFIRHVVENEYALERHAIERAIARRIEQGGAPGGIGKRTSGPSSRRLLRLAEIRRAIAPDAASLLAGSAEAVAMSTLIGDGRAESQRNHFVAILVGGDRRRPAAIGTTGVGAEHIGGLVSDLVELLATWETTPLEEDTRSIVFASLLRARDLQALAENDAEAATAAALAALTAALLAQRHHRPECLTIFDVWARARVPPGRSKKLLAVAESLISFEFWAWLAERSVESDPAPSLLDDALGRTSNTRSRGERFAKEGVDA